MSDPGLTNRLRQRSRRAGLAVGLSMALTIAVCIGAFAWIFVQAEPLFADLVGSDATAVRSATRTPTPEGGGSDDNEDAAQSEPTATVEEADAPEPTEAPTAAPTATATPEQFQATHLSNPNSGVNFRTGPSLDSDVIVVLPAGTALQAIGGSETDGDGNQWLEFKTEDGQEGWLREDAFVSN